MKAKPFRVEEIVSERWRIGAKGNEKTGVKPPALIDGSPLRTSIASARLPSVRRFPWTLVIKVFAAVFFIANLRPAAAKVLEGADIPMRDGVALKADVFLPEGEGPFPVLIHRTPYGRKGLKGEGEKLAWRGIATVNVDARGRFESGGEWEPFLHEGPDGADTVRWVAAQPWCNGRTAAAGGSYLGVTQWGMVSEPDAPVLAIQPVAAASGMYDVLYQGGLFSLNTALGWGFAMRDKSALGPPDDLFRIRKEFNTLPLIEADDRAGKQVDYIDAWLLHPTKDDYWARGDVGGDFRSAPAAVLSIAGWYDMFLGPQVMDFQAVQDSAPLGRGREAHLIVGPWDHSSGLASPMMKLPQSAGFTKMNELKYAWIERWLLEKENAASHLPPVRLFVMGDDRWEDFDRWPPPGYEAAAWFFHSGGKAALLADGAALTRQAPAGSEPFDSYVYDPADPTPSRGGNVLAEDLGPRDHSDVESRPDLLIYQTAPLEKAVELVGSPRLILYAATDACGTDFIGRLLAVPPDGGPALFLTEGAARTQALGLVMEPGKAAKVEIEFWPTAFQFKPGWRIRLHVASAAFPRWDRNPNVCDGPAALARELKAAAQTIFHDAERPSQLALPVKFLE